MRYGPMVLGCNPEGEVSQAKKGAHGEHLPIVWHHEEELPKLRPTRPQTVHAHKHIPQTVSEECAGTFISAQWVRARHLWAPAHHPKGAVQGLLGREAGRHWVPAPACGAAAPSWADPTMKGCSGVGLRCQSTQQCRAAAAQSPWLSAAAGWSGKCRPPEPTWRLTLSPKQHPQLLHPHS